MMKKRILGWIFVSLFIGGAVSLLASSHPDGYEKAGEEMGIMDRATSFFRSPLPDYSIPGIDSWLSSSLAGIVGVMITFFVFLFLGKIVGKRK